MATKKKRTTALFDVISKSQRYQTPVRNTAPSWWPFGRKKTVANPAKSGGAAPAAVAPAPAAPPQPARPAIAAQSATASTPLMSPRTEAAASDRYPAPQIEPNRTDHDHDELAEYHVARQADHGADDNDDQDDELPTVAHPLRKSLEYAVDPERKVIAFRMNYTVAIIGAFSVVVIVGLAVIVGQHLRGEPSPLMTPSLAALQASPANRSVMTVPPRASATGRSKAELAGQQLPPAGGNTAPPFNEPRPPADFVTNDGQRYVGLNYVIIQSYRPTEEKMAKEACEFLNKNKVGCTIEQHLKGWDNLFVVVGNKGFDRISTAAFKTYVTDIQRLSLIYAGSAKGYKAFQPSPKKWDRQEDKPRPS